MDLSVSLPIPRRRLAVVIPGWIVQCWITNDDGEEAVLLSGVGQIRRAFIGPKNSGDSLVDNAVALVSGLDRDGGLGFFGRAKPSDALRTAIRVLAEHGQSLNTEQTLQVVTQLKTLADAQAVRARFVVQASISGAVLFASLSVLGGAVMVTPDIQKVAIGLVGTVVGYWLR